MTTLARRILAAATGAARGFAAAIRKLNGGASGAFDCSQTDPTYALIFVERRGPRFQPFWQVRDGPRGAPVAFTCRARASGYAEDLLDGRRGQIIWA